MAVTIVETRAITGGVDTHADVHVAAALDPIGGLLGVREFPATTAGYARLLDWLAGFGTVALVGIEGTGSYGAGLSRHMASAGVRVVEVDRSDRQDRRRQGKSDPLDAVSAARAAQSGRARGAPKGRDGDVEAIRALMVARRSATGERTRAINQARALLLTGPDDLRARFTRHTPAALVAGIAACGPAPAISPAMPSASRCASWDDALSSSTASSSASTSSSSPSSPPAPRACSPCTGSAPHRRAAAHRGRGPPWATPVRGRLGAPVRRRPDPRLFGESHPPPAQPRRRPASQPCPVADRVHPYGLGPGHPRLRRAPHHEGKSKAEIIRCLKRYVAREVYPHLRPASR